MRLKKIREIIIIGLISVVAFIIPQRNLQHLLCGVAIPQMYNIISSKIKIIQEIYKNGYKFYFAWAIFWESIQFWQRGYFQVDQILCDMLGIAISYIMFEKVLRKRV